jgi:branched-subunit amino acid transport protein
MIHSDLYVWMIIASLSLGSFAIRFSFLGFIGDRQLPKPLERALGYTSVAILPGIAMPMVLSSSTGDIEPIRLIAAFLTLFVGAWTRSLLYSLLAGILSYSILMAVF